MMIWWILSLLGLNIKDIKDIKYLGTKSKIILCGYFIYTFFICIFMKILFKANYIDYLTIQLVFFSRYFDYLKNTLQSSIMVVNLKIINEIEKLIKKNKNEKQTKNSIELIKKLREAFEFDDVEKIKEIVKKLSSITSDLLFLEKIKIKKETKKFIIKNKNNKKMIKKVKKILKRKIQTIVEFQLYKLDIEKIIGKVDD